MMQKDKEKRMAEKKIPTKRTTAKAVTKPAVTKKTVAKSVGAKNEKAASSKKAAVKNPTEKKTTATSAKSGTKTSKSKAAKPDTTKVDFRGMTPKEIATAKGEPWINVLSVELDPENIGNGAFELDWNEKFITNLVRAGYKGKTDADMVDQWFSDVCRNVLAENFEQWEANQPVDARPRIVGRRDLGDGLTEVS